MRASSTLGRRRGVRVAVTTALLLVGMVCAVAVGASATPRVPCSAPGSAKHPCFFSTPSRNIHCRWTPTSQSVECVLVSSHRGYRLRPTGKAKAIHVALPRHGERLPAGNVSIVFPHALSCRSTRTTMTCNQDFLTGFFKLAPHGSHSG